MFYKNVSRATRTFCGVTFPPGGEGEVKGYIHAEGFIRIDKLSNKPQKPKKVSKPSKEPIKKPIKQPKADIPSEPQMESDNTEGGNT